MDSLLNKKILMGVTSSIAIYKAIELIRLLRRAGATVKVVMTQAATWLVSPLTFETISQNPVCTHLFKRDSDWEIEHIALARWADLMVIAPATANIIGKMAHGIADDSLSTIFLAYKGDVIIAPAMNTAMYENPALQENLAQLKQRGINILEPPAGDLACGEEGKGRLMEPQDILNAIANHFSTTDDLSQKTVLITAGPTREYIDDVRFISNPSSGKMGSALAIEAARRGAHVILILGPVSFTPPCHPNITIVNVISASDMLEATLEHINTCDIAIFAAAVSDFKPDVLVAGKVKKEDTLDTTLNLVKNPDIALECSKVKKREQLFIGFAAETGENIQEAQRKMERKNFNIIVLNDISVPGSGFASDMNKVTVLDDTGNLDVWDLMPKNEVASKLFDVLYSYLLKKNNLHNTR